MNADSPTTRSITIARRSSVRRGGTTAGLLVTLVAFGTLSAAAVIITPQFLSAGTPTAPQPVAARSAQHQQVIDLLGALIGRSHAVLAIHARGPTPYHEIVLWLEDQEHLGRVDAVEVAILSHSATLQTISLAALDQEESEAEPAPDGPTFDPRGRYGPEFCTAWRARADVSRRVLAGGVSSMVVRPEGDASRLALTLTWASDSTDGPDVASTLVDARSWPSAFRME